MNIEQLQQLQQNWDAQAAAQLRAELRRLQAEIDALQRRAERAEERADFWMNRADQVTEELFDACERNCEQVGLTPGGHMVAVTTKGDFTK